AAKQSSDTRDELSFLKVALLAFAGVAVFVGAFIIFNTFSITVVQRIREFALLRTLGASRRQVLFAVLTEGLVLGLLGSAVVLAVGLFASLSSSVALSLLGAGAAALFLGVALLSPRLVRPLASLVGTPLERAFGITGRLARENSVRQPGRTAATAAALMIGV